MTIGVNVSGTTKNVTGVHVRVGGALKQVTGAYIRVNGALKQFYGVITIALSSYSILGRGSSATTLPVTSAPVTATVTGGVGTLTHAWTRTDSGTQPWTIDDPASATTTFTTSCAQGQSFTASFKDTVTDQAGQVIASNPVSVSCANIYYGGGYPGIIPGTPGQPYP